MRARTQADAAVLLALRHPGPWTARALASAANQAIDSGVGYMARAAEDDPGLCWLVSCRWFGGLLFLPEAKP